MFNTTDFPPILPKSSNMLTYSFDIERAKGDTHLWEFDLHFSSLEGYSSPEGALAILSTAMPSLGTTASINLCDELNFSSKALTCSFTSSIPTSLVRLTYIDILNSHSN